MPGAFAAAEAARGLNRRLVDSGTLLSVTEPGRDAWPAGPDQPLLVVVWRHAPRPLALRATIRRGDSAWSAPSDLLDARGALRLAPARDEAFCDSLEAEGIPLGELVLCGQGVVPGPARIGPRTLARLVRHRRGPGAVSRAEIDAAAETLRCRVGEGVFELTEQEVQDLQLGPRERSLLRPLLSASRIPRGRCNVTPDRLLLDLRPETCATLTGLPALAAHLGRFRPLLELRRETREGKRSWFHLHWPRDPALFSGPTRLLAVRQTRTATFSLVEGDCWVDLAVNVLRPRPGRGGSDLLARLMEVLNGPDFERWYRTRGKCKGDVLQVDAGPLLRFPVPRQKSSLR